MTPAEARSKLAGDRTFDGWDETKRLWFCGRVVDIHSEIESLKDPNYNVLLAKLKSSLRKTIAALEPLSAEAVDHLFSAPIESLPGVLPPSNADGLMELLAFGTTARRLLAMPKPILRELTTATDADPGGGVSAGGNPGNRRKWRNDVATVMVRELLEEAGVKIVTTMGSQAMRLTARVLDCLQRRAKPRHTESARKRLERPAGKNRREK